MIGEARHLPLKVQISEVFVVADIATQDITRNSFI